MLIIGVGGRRYLLVRRLATSRQGGVRPLDPPAGQSTLRRAIEADARVAGAIRRRFDATFPVLAVHDPGGHGLARRIADLIAGRQLVLIDLGPAAVARVASPPLPTPAGDRSFVEKLRIVVTGIARVPRQQIAAEARADFDRLVREMTSGPALVGTIVFVLAAWAAAQFTGPVGWVLDAAIVAVAVYAMGTAAFAWFERVGALFVRINGARSEAELAACSAVLVNLIIEIGVTAFLTLITRAVARRLPRPSGKRAGANEPPDETGVPKRKPVQPVPGSDKPVPPKQGAPKPDPSGPSSVASKVSQKQLRHIEGRPEYRGGGYLSSVQDAQKVLDTYRSGQAEVLGRSTAGFPVVRVPGVTGFNVNDAAGFARQPTNIFMIKGTASPSVVPLSPAWSPR